MFPVKQTNKTLVYIDASLKFQPFYANLKKKLLKLQKEELAQVVALNNI